jgi:hypothetical protein
MTKAQSFVEGLSPELKQVVINMAETLRPMLDEIHERTPTTQKYYGDYFRILSYRPEHHKVIALALLYAGANPEGLEAAVRLM